MINNQYLLRIIRSTCVAVLLIVLLLLFLFKGIMETYAYTDGYEFLWNSATTNFLTVFLEQGRAVSGWINSMIYPHIHHVSDLTYIRIVNLICLLFSSVLIYGILRRNTINELHSLAIVIIFICSPFSSIVVHWEAASSCIWGYPLALLSGELIFTSMLNLEKIEKKRFNIKVISGTLLGIISLFIYQPDYTAFIFPAFIHLISGKERNIIWKFLGRHIIIYAVYFLLFKLQLNQLHILPNERAGISLSEYKLLWFMKGAFFMSLHHAIIFASNEIIYLISAISLMLTGYFIYTNKDDPKNNRFNFLLHILMFYMLAYLPSLISVDNAVSYRTMGTVTLLSSSLLILSIAVLPLKSIFTGVSIAIIAIFFSAIAYQNNKSFTDIQSKEYNAVKKVMEEKLMQGFPQKVLVIMPDENFLVKQNLINSVVTDEFGKLSNTVSWVPQYFVFQLIYELTNDRSKALTIEVTYCKKNELPSDFIQGNNDWILDIEQIYLSKANDP